MTDLSPVGDIVERLTRDHADTTRQGLIDLCHEAADEIERLRALSSDMLAVLNACRIIIKNRDQRPNEMKLLDAIKIVIANAEDVLGGAAMTDIVEWHKAADEIERLRAAPS